MSKKTSRTKTVIEDNFRGPKAEPKQTVTLAEALAESGETMDDLQAPAEEDRPERPEGTSNLATTIRNHRARYVTALHPNGKKTQNNGDEVAKLLLPIPLEKLRAFSATRFDGRAYLHLNPGHARMCIGNLIRAAVKRGDEDVLLWLQANQPSDEEQPTEEPKAPAKKAPAKRARKAPAKKAPAKKAAKKAE